MKDQENKLQEPESAPKEHELVAEGLLLPLERADLPH